MGSNGHATDGLASRGRGSACDCPPPRSPGLTFLIEVDGSRAVAMVKATETSGRIVELGNATTAERQFMAKEFQDQTGSSLK